MMAGLLAAARHRPLVTFFVLAYGLSWSLWIPLAVLRDAVPGALVQVLLLVGSLVPSAVAIALTAVNQGALATRDLLGRLLIWRVDPRWYLLLLGPAAVVIAAITLAAVFFDGPPVALGVPFLTAISMIAFMTFPGSAAGEEVGWRGYALPRLQNRRSALTASLVLGMLHAGWHLPLWLRGPAGNPIQYYAPFVIQAVAFAVIYTWLYNSTRGSLLLAVLFHTSTNAPVTLLLVPMGADKLGLPLCVMAGLTLMAAIVIIAVFRPADLSRQRRQKQPTAGVLPPLPSGRSTRPPDGHI